MTTPEFPDIGTMIEDLVWEHDISYMEAALMLAERLDIEEENIGALILSNPNIVAKIREEAENLHYVPKEHRFEDA